MNKQTLQDVISSYESDGLFVHASNEVSSISSFPFSSFKDIHKYLEQLLTTYSKPYFFPRWDSTKFSKEENKYIKSISTNKGEFKVSFLKGSYVGTEGGDMHPCLIERTKKRVNHVDLLQFVEKEPKPEIEFSLPLPIYINAVNSFNPQFGFFSLYDDLNLANIYFHIYRQPKLDFKDAIEDAWQNAGQRYENSKAKINDPKMRNFINDLSKIDGTMYFSYHGANLADVICAHGVGVYCYCYLHFFSICEPDPSWADFSEDKRCDVYSFACS